ncbi:hypothetical protein J6590_004080 [Homalodisca vitripennis]|nr:hypothetical protein J6590_004080 [Homalodisca vitripennis]
MRGRTYRAHTGFVLRSGHPHACSSGHGPVLAVQENVSGSSKLPTITIPTSYSHFTMGPSLLTRVYTAFLSINIPLNVQLWSKLPLISLIGVLAKFIANLLDSYCVGPLNMCISLSSGAGRDWLRLCGSSSSRFLEFRKFILMAIKVVSL